MKPGRAAKAIAARALLGIPSYWSSMRRRRAMAVLCYHRVSEGADPLGLAVTPDEFALHMDELAGSRQVEAVDAARFEAIWHGRAAYGPRVPVLVTFDDGYRDNLLDALPLMRSRGIPAVVFVATGVLEGQPLWYDLLERVLERHPRDARSELAALLGREAYAGVAGDDLPGWVRLIKRLDSAGARAVRACLERLSGGWSGGGRYLSADDLRAWIDAGNAVGAHTRLHPALSRVDDATALAEMEASKRALETLLKAPVRLFAYPFGEAGDFAETHVAMLGRLGYTMAFTTISGLNRAGDPALTVRRKCVNGGLFARPGANFDAALFKADLMGLGPGLRACVRGTWVAGRRA